MAGQPLSGESDDYTVPGVWGHNSGVDPNDGLGGIGTYGLSEAGVGVQGLAPADTGLGVLGMGGIHALDGSLYNGSGVVGLSTYADGVRGLSSGAGSGVNGTHLAAGPGVLGESAAGNGVVGRSSEQGASGVLGEHLGGGVAITGRTTGGSPAIVADQSGGTGIAVQAIGHANHGVLGLSNSGAHSGILGENSDTGFGVAGTSQKGVGVLGATSSDNPAVSGTNGGSGVGVTGTSVAGTGVSGETSIQTSFGVYGRNLAGGTAVAGESDSLLGIGVAGSNSADGIGTFGYSQQGSGVMAVSLGNWGLEAVNRGQNVHGAACFSHNDGAGKSIIASTASPNVFAVEITCGPASGPVLWNGPSAGLVVVAPNGEGVCALAGSQVFHGVEGHNYNSAGTGCGVYGSAVSGPGVYGASLGASPAAYFVGDVEVTGALVAAAKGFKIDHPVVPEERYLTHWSIESSELLVSYSGNAVTDEAGRGVIVLPEYVEHLAEDFRYQLTPIGTMCRVMVERELAGTEIIIRTDEPSVKVSWSVTGVRKDAYAKSVSFDVEHDKAPDDVGRYLHPEAYGRDGEVPIGTISSLIASIAETGNPSNESE